MQTKILMIGSAAAMFGFGVLLTFAPRELLLYSGSNPQPMSVLAIQAAGALYLGFAILNWMGKENLIGGIYSRPVALGNFLHFLVFAIALIKAISSGYRGNILVVMAFIYTLFAVWFGLVTFGSPVKRLDR